MVKIDVNHLIESGTNPDKIVDVISYQQLYNEVERLIGLGADPVKIGKKLTSGDIIKKLPVLAKDADVVNKLLGKKGASGYIIKPQDVNEHHRLILDYGGDPDKVAGRMTRVGLNKYLKTVLEYGANPNCLLKRLDSRVISDNKELLVECGADINKLAREMEHDQVIENYEFLKEHGATNIKFHIA